MRVKGTAATTMPQADGLSRLGIESPASSLEPKGRDMPASAPAHSPLSYSSMLHPLSGSRPKTHCHTTLPFFPSKHLLSHPQRRSLELSHLRPQHSSTFSQASKLIQSRSNSFGIISKTFEKATSQLSSAPSYLTRSPILSTTGYHYHRRLPAKTPLDVAWWGCPRCRRGHLLLRPFQSPMRIMKSSARCAIKMARAVGSAASA